MQPSLPKVNVSSTEVEMTNGDRTWDTRLTKTAEHTKIPLNPLTPIYGVILEWVLSLTQ